MVNQSTHPAMLSSAAATLLLAVWWATETSGKPHALLSATPDNTAFSRLMIPQNLSKANGYEHKVALFGISPGGVRMAHTVYYAQSDLCDNDVDTSTGVPIRDIDDRTQKMMPWPSPYILMVDRGNCTFVQKVRNAQNAGAAGVLFADNKCLCMDQECLSNNNPVTCETISPTILDDDGSGGDISIPSFLMFKNDADRLIAELEANNNVVLEMTWSVPNPDERVEYALWTTPVNTVSNEFVRDFQIVADALSDRAYFTPHMYIYDGVRSDCMGDGGENTCFSLCTNNGRYCAVDPDNDLNDGISGADVVKESLRRICIWDMYGSENGIGTEWWSYVAIFEEQCHTPENFTDSQCIENAYNQSMANASAIKICMVESAGNNNTNSKLEIALASQEQVGMASTPIAFVNEAIIRAQLNVHNMFSAVCSGFSNRTMPEVCIECAGNLDPSSCIESIELNPSDEPSMSPSHERSRNSTLESPTISTQGSTLPSHSPVSSIPTEDSTPYPSVDFRPSVDNSSSTANESWSSPSLGSSPIPTHVGSSNSSIGSSSSPPNTSRERAFTTRLSMFAIHLLPMIQVCFGYLF